MTDPQKELQKTRKRVDEADEVRQRLANLRDKKKQKLEQSKNEKDTQTQDSPKYFNGTINEVKENGHGKAELTIEYALNGELHTERFTLPLPKNPDEYSVQNEYVRLRQTVDVEQEQVLIGREVPLKATPNGTVTLDIPNSTTQLGLLKHKLNRATQSSKTYEVITRLTENKVLTDTLRTGLGTLMLTLSFIIAANAFSTIGIKFLVDVMLSSIPAVIIAAPLLFGERETRNSVTITSTLLTIVGVVTVHSLLTGGTPTVWLSEEHTFYENAVTALQYGLLTTLTLAGLANLSKTDSMREYAKQKLSKVKKKIQMWRGVEYVKD